MTRWSSLRWREFGIIWSARWPIDERRADWPSQAVGRSETDTCQCISMFLAPTPFNPTPTWENDLKLRRRLVLVQQSTRQTTRNHKTRLTMKCSPHRFLLVGVWPKGRQWTSQSEIDSIVPKSTRQQNCRIEESCSDPLPQCENTYLKAGQAVPRGHNLRPASHPP
jgi:hypothetical protein